MITILFKVDRIRPNQSGSFKQTSIELVPVDLFVKVDVDDQIGTVDDDNNVILSLAGLGEVYGKLVETFDTVSREETPEDDESPWGYD